MDNRSFAPLRWALTLNAIFFSMLHFVTSVRTLGDISTHTMITTAEFKKQVAKTFGNEMRKFGFKGTGFDYFSETDDYLFAVWIESRWGGSCSSGLAIHPKLVDRDSEGKLNLKKLKIHQYEFKLSLSGQGRSDRWKYSDEKEQNEKTIDEIKAYVTERALPVIELFNAKPNILDRFEVSELKNFHRNFTKKTGTYIATTELRFAWALTVFFENKNILKARQFAEYGVSQLEKNDSWFGMVDFKRVLRENNVA